MKQILSMILFMFMFSGIYSQDFNNRLDSLMKKYYKDGEPGAFLCIELKGKIIFKKGYGLANRETQSKIGASTNFNIGSVTKQFTAFAILKLAAENRLSLEDHLTKFFPDFNQKIGGSINIRQLLTHSSGIIDHYEYTDTLKIRHAADRDVLMAVQNLDSTYFPPGTKYRYSNTAYCLLGMIIEKISGMPYAAYIRENILQPLGMKRAAIFEPGISIPERAIGYDRSNDGKSFHRLDADQSIFFSTEADGGLYTSIDEYVKWLESLELGMHEGNHLVMAARSPQFQIDASKFLAYGFGWFIGGNGEQQAVYHTGSNGGFRAIVYTLPKENDAVIIFSNRSDIDLESLVQDINNLLHISNKYFSKIESLVSFRNSSPNFAPCKKIKSYSTSFAKNWKGNAMALN
jgi:CubicO group peptidase (beta-lactamase class C family)